jgi:glucan 1,3-beta-glucosidase
LNTAANSALPLRGVNLGGWLVLEKWMTPSLFAGLAATDETTWCVEQGPAAAPRLRAHWDSFITQDDLFWLAGVGINAVRIPLVLSPGMGLPVLERCGGKPDNPEGR